MKPGIITQARTGSTRLPGKILKTINDKTLLEYHLERASWAELPVYVATTERSRDDAIVSLLETTGHPWFRGSESDVLRRFHNCAEQFKLDPIVRITSDCPLLDGHLIRRALDTFNPRKIDYLSNTINRTYPRGMDFEIFTYETLETLHKTATSDFNREHVTSYIDEHRSRFEVQHFTAEEDLSEYRLTVDYPEDFAVIKQLIAEHRADRLPYPELKELIKTEKDLFQRNNDLEQDAG